MTQRLGRKVHHDPASKQYPARRATTHRPVTHKTLGPVLDQGDLGSCVANAGAHALNTIGSHRKPSPIRREPDAIDFYVGATAIDPFPGQYLKDGTGQDTGTDGNSLAKYLRNVGLISSWFHCFGVDHLLGALQLQPVMIGIPWHKGMYTPDANGFVHPDGDVVGGHETLVRCDNPDKEYVTVRNSWGPGWGLHGHYRLTYADLAALLADQGDATVLNP